MSFKKSPKVCLVRNQLRGVIIENLDVLWTVAMVASGNLVFGKEEEWNWIEKFGTLTASFTADNEGCMSS